MKNFIILSRLFSGLVESITSEELRPTGIPAFINLATKCSNRYKTTWVISCKTPSESTVINNRRKYIKIDDIQFIILPYIVISPKLRKINNHLNSIITFIFLFKLILSLSNKTTLYSDRSNITTAALIKKMRLASVVIRILGVYPDQKKLADKLRYKLRNPLKYFAYKTNFDLVVATQDGSGTELYLDKLLRKNTPRRILINGVDHNQNIRIITDKKINLLFVGTLTESKGIIDLLNSIKILKDRFNGFQLNIIGKGPLFEYSKKYIEINELNSNVKVLGALTKDEVFNYYGNSDIYISTNKYGNLSNTVLEAAAHGLCLLLLSKDDKTKTDIFTFQYFNNTAIFIERCNLIENLSNELIKLISNNNLITEFSERICRFSLNNFSTWEERIEFELNLIEQKVTKHKINK